MRAIFDRFVAELDGVVDERWIDVVKDEGVRANPQPSAPRNMTLWFGGVRSFKRDGTARQAARVGRQLHVRLYTRKAVDTRGQDPQWLMNPNFGHWPFELAVINALHDYWPVDPDDSTRNLTSSPIYLSEGDSTAVTAKSKDPNQGESVVSFDVQYVVDLTQRTPPWS